MYENRPQTSARTSASPVAPRFLTISEAARYCSCAVWAIRSAIWAKELKACKIGRRFVIPREELDRYVDRLIDDRENSGYPFQS
jgi:excisionase family DNA binding protein